MSIMRVLSFLVLVLCVSEAGAFRADEEGQLLLDLKEARSRATDFKAHVKRLKDLEIARERYAQESKDARARVEEAFERSRLAYVKERNSKVPDDAIRERLEKEFEAQKARDEEKMNTARIIFLRKKRAIAETIAREATIDENVEFDLTP